MCDDRKILTPFNPHEAISTQEAEEMAVCVRTVAMSNEQQAAGPMSAALN
jgi:hypothetical protein